MLKKTIQFKDLDGNDVIDDFYFNLSKADIAKLELSTDGGMSKYLEKIIAAENGKDIIDTMEMIIKLSYGVRSVDNRRFIKNDDVWNDFFETDAYSVLFMELCTEAKKSAEFMIGIAPQDLADGIENTPAIPTNQDPAWITEDREPTKAEMMAMSTSELSLAFKVRAEREAANTKALETVKE